MAFLRTQQTINTMKGSVEDLLINIVLRLEESVEYAVMPGMQTQDNMKLLVESLPMVS